MEVLMHYLAFYEQDFARARSNDKRATKLTVLWTATLNGMIAAVSAVIAFTGLAWLGVVSVFLAGGVTVIGAWDGLYRHRDLWRQRSLVLGQIQAVRREVEFRQARGDGEASLAEDAMKRLNTILDESLMAWGELREQAADRPVA